MSDEQTKKPEHIYIPAVREFDNQRTMITNIRNPLNKLEFFEVLWDVPQMADGVEAAEAACQERYGCNLQTVIEAGIRNFTTRPDYLSVGFEFEKDEKGNDIRKQPLAMKPNGHEEMQTLADGFQPGRPQRVGESVKAKAAKADAMEAKLKEFGVSNLDDLLAKAAEMGLTG
jgi:hypothetical protein